MTSVIKEEIPVKLSMSVKSDTINKKFNKKLSVSTKSQTGISQTGDKKLFKLNHLKISEEDIKKKK